jgi:hypothetical protein
LNAEQIVAEGNLAAFAMNDSGSILTAWHTCDFAEDTDCGTAWRLGTGPQTQATVIVGPGDARMGVAAAGDSVIARIHDGTCSYPVECRSNDLVRISPDGTWEPIIAR